MSKTIWSCRKPLSLISPGLMVSPLNAMPRINVSIIIYINVGTKILKWILTHIHLFGKFKHQYEMWRKLSKSGNIELWDFITWITICRFSVVFLISIMAVTISICNNDNRKSSTNTSISLKKMLIYGNKSNFTPKIGWQNFNLDLNLISNHNS